MTEHSLPWYDSFNVDNELFTLNYYLYSHHLHIFWITVIRRHLFSMMAPQQPKNPTRRTRMPAAIQSTVALRKLKDGDREA